MSEGRVRHSRKNSLNNDSTIDLEEQTKIAEQEELKMAGGGDLDEGLIYEDSVSEEDHQHLQAKEGYQIEAREPDLQPSINPVKLHEHNKEKPKIVLPSDLYRKPSGNQVTASNGTTFNPEELLPLSKRTFQARRAKLQQEVPNISSKCWCIFDLDKMSLIYGKREYLKRECASLTKIMTAYVAIKLCQQWKLSIEKTEVTVSDVASDIRGTSANLETGDILTVEQLLYGLMLPSGNDAAFALAQFFGRQLFRRKYSQADITKIKSYQFNYHPYYAKYFLREMNLYAEKM